MIYNDKIKYTAAAEARTGIPRGGADMFAPAIPVTSGSESELPSAISEKKWEADDGCPHCQNNKTAAASQSVLGTGMRVMDIQSQRRTSIQSNFLKTAVT